MTELVTHTIQNPILPQPLVITLLLTLCAAVTGVMLWRKERVREICFTSVRLLAIAVLLILVNRRSMQGIAGREVMLKNIDILCVVDSTISMWAEDYEGSTPRMEGVARDLGYLAESLPGCSFCLLTFDNYARVMTPFTQDASVFQDALSAIIMPDGTQALGSTFTTPYTLMQEFLESSASKKDRETFVLFVTDGEHTADATLPPFEELQDYINGGMVLGYGSAEGGRMRYPGSYLHNDTADKFTYIQDPGTGTDALSVLDEEALQLIAESLGLEYRHVTQRSDMDELIKMAETKAFNVPDRLDEIDYRDTYRRYLPLLLLLSAYSMFRYIRRGRL